MASTIAAPTFSSHLFRHRRRFSPPHAGRTDHHHPFARRDLLLSTATTSTFLLPISPAPATTPETVGSPTPQTASPKITDRVFMDFSVCPSYFRPDRSIGFELSSCPDSEPLGRIVFGLYGKLVPITVANFKTMCKSATYRGTLVHKLLEGQYFAAGRQGRKDKGEVRIPLDLVSKNSETVNPKSFQLTHMKPGTLSLCLSENDDYDEVRLDPEYRNVQFLVTTGPGPCPSLDNGNIVFGTVLEGLEAAGEKAACSMAALAMSSSCNFHPSIPIESSRFCASRSLPFPTPRFDGGMMKESSLSIGGTRRRILPKVEAHNQTFNSFDDLLQMTDKPVLVDFYATWCGPCKYMVGVLEEVSAKMGDRIQVVKIDTEKYTEISNSYGVEALPTFIIFNKGKPCNRFEGALSVDKLIDHIEKVLATLN